MISALKGPHPGFHKTILTFSSCAKIESYGPRIVLSNFCAFKINSLWTSRTDAEDAGPVSWTFSADNFWYAALDEETVESAEVMAALCAAMDSGVGSMIDVLIEFFVIALDRYTENTPYLLVGHEGLYTSCYIQWRHNSNFRALFVAPHWGSSPSPRCYENQIAQITSLQPHHRKHNFKIHQLLQIQVLLGWCRMVGCWSLVCELITDVSKLHIQLWN